MTMNGKTALVVGGGSGIGLAIAEAFSGAGCKTAIAGRREETLRQACEAAGAGGLLCHTVDVADRASVLALIKWAEEELGKIDIFVNSAGLNIRDRTLAAMKPEEWDHVLAVHATGAYNCLYAVLPGMRRRGDGVVVNISSIAGKRAVPLGGVAYNASKFAMTALGTAAWLEEAKNGIRVTNVYPGEVNTPILENRPAPVSDAHKAAILQPQDVAAMVLALAQLPPRAHVPEIVVKPLQQDYV